MAGKDQTTKAVAKKSATRDTAKDAPEKAAKPEIQEVKSEERREGGRVPIGGLSEPPISDQLAHIRLQKEKLELEDLTMRVENEKNRRAAIANAHRVQQETLDKANQDIIASQAMCKHRKGGKGMQGILKGHDSNYSVIKHTYPWGVIGVMCTRCSKEVLPPAERLRHTDPAKFAAQMEEYKEWLDLPTDNEPSGTQIFMITRQAAGAPATA